MTMVFRFVGLNAPVGTHLESCLASHSLNFAIVRKFTQLHRINICTFSILVCFSVFGVQYPVVMMVCLGVVA